jgi:hypothetical protein
MRVVKTSYSDSNDLTGMIEDRATTVAPVKGQGRLPQARRAMHVAKHAFSRGHGFCLTNHFGRKPEGEQAGVLFRYGTQFDGESLCYWPAFGESEESNIVFFNSAYKL